MTRRSRAGAWLLGATLLGLWLGWRPAGKLLSTARAMLRSTAQFKATETDPRVLFEPGAEAAAQVVALALPKAVLTVESRQGAPFAAPIRVYVCASIESFVAYGASPRAGGLTLNGRIFLSPKPENTAERLPRVLAHELSHLQMEQYLGALAWNRNCPVWFQEGLAVAVSGGAGAENVTLPQALEALAQGRTFRPEPAGGLFERHGAHAAGLSEHLFYRQAGLFVEWLRRLDASKFQAFLASVREGRALDEALQGAYAMSLDAAWLRFAAAAKSSLPYLQASPKTAAFGVVRIQT